MADCTETLPIRTRQTRAAGAALSPGLPGGLPGGLLFLLLICVTLPRVSAAEPDDAAVEPLDVLVEVSTDSDAAYTQSLVRYRVRVLARVPIRDATLSEPMADGALIHRLGDDRRFDAEREGSRYRVIERLYAVIPQRPGALTIAGPSLSAAVPVRALDRGAASDTLMERRALVYRRAEDLSLEVRPPPAAAERPWLPVASLSITEHWQPDGSQVRVGEPIERRIVVEATGIGAASIALPDAPEVAGLHVYPQPAETIRRELGEDLLVTTTLRQTLVPTVPGILRLPALRLPWWSVDMDEPRQASLPARDLVVAGPAPTRAAPTDADRAWRERFLARASADAQGGSWLVLVFAAAWLVTLLLWWRERRQGRQDSGVGSDSETGEPSSAYWIRRLRRACARGEAKSARDALAGWARTQSSVAGRLRIDAALRSRGAGNPELALVRELDRRVYAPGGALQTPWDGKAMLDALVPMLDDMPGREPSATRAALPPLFPERRVGG